MLITIDLVTAVALIKSIFILLVVVVLGMVRPRAMTRSNGGNSKRLHCHPCVGQLINNNNSNSNSNSSNSKMTTKRRSFLQLSSMTSWIYSLTNTAINTSSTRSWKLSLRGYCLSCRTGLLASCWRIEGFLFSPAPLLLVLRTSSAT